jgi:hypothetical protein
MRKWQTDEGNAPSAACCRVKNHGISSVPLAFSPEATNTDVIILATAEGLISSRKETLLCCW